MGFRELLTWKSLDVPQLFKKGYTIQLGLLGQLAEKAALIEPFRNAVKISEMRSFMNKFFYIIADIEVSGLFRHLCKIAVELSDKTALFKAS